jgi:hypothetical protein
VLSLSFHLLCEFSSQQQPLQKLNERSMSYLNLNIPSSIFCLFASRTSNFATCFAISASS